MDDPQLTDKEEKRKRKREVWKIWYEKNKDKMRAYYRKAHEKNKEKRNQASRERYERNKEKHNSQSSEYHEKNREQILARKKENLKVHGKEIYARRKARALIKKNRDNSDLLMLVEGNKLDYCERMKVKCFKLPCGERLECFYAPQCLKVPEGKQPPVVTFKTNFIF